MHRVILAAGVAILLSLGIILARSQGRAQPGDARSASTASNPRHLPPMPMTAAKSADLHSDAGASPAPH
jgi:hypothetical protein